MSDFGSGHDLTVCEFKPLSGSVLTALSLEPASDSVSPSLSVPPLHALSLSLSLSLSRSEERRVGKECNLSGLKTYFRPMYVL